MESLGERERGSWAGEHDDRGVLRRLRAETQRTVLREVRPRQRGDRRSAACQLSFGNPGRSSATCRLFGNRRSVAGHLFFDSRSAADLTSSSDDDEDGIVDMVVRGKRTRTRNPCVFNDDFL